MKLLTIDHSQVIPRVPFRGLYIMPHVSPKRKNHIKNYRRAHRQQRGVNKILTNAGCGNAYAVTYRRTNTKGIPFNKAFEFVHATKLKNPF